MNSSRLTILLCLAVLAIPDHSQVLSPPPDASQYVGSDSCHSCHEEPYDLLTRTAHAKLLDHSRPVDKQGCEACHGPGAAHVNSNGDRAKIFSFKGAPAREINKRCSGCHQVHVGSAHLRGGMSCLNCHSPHNYKQAKNIMTQEPSSLCFSCHRTPR